MLSFPLSIDAFFGGLCPLDWTFYLPDTRVSEETRGGEIIDADIGVRLWAGSVQLARSSARDAAALQAAISVLQQAGRSFLVYPRHAAFPRLDPKGLVLGASAPIIHALPSAREIQISGLPSGYVISPGDFLSFAYGASPVRQALHQVVVGATASAGGVTPALEVMPPIRAGAAIGAGVQLARPFCKAKIIPGSTQVQRFSRTFSDAPSFDFIQTLR